MTGNEINQKGVKKDVETTLDGCKQKAGATNIDTAIALQQICRHYKWQNRQTKQLHPAINWNFTAGCLAFYLSLSPVLPGHLPYLL